MEERIFNLSKTVLAMGASTLNTLIDLKFLRRLVGLSYHNECMKFDIGFERYIDEVADRNSIDDLTFMIKLGSFGNKGKSSCS